MQIPTINIATKRETYYIKNKQINMETEETKEQRGQEESNPDYERYYQDESWKLAKTSKKTQNNSRYKCRRKPSYRKAAMAARITTKQLLQLTNRRNRR